MTIQSDSPATWAIRRRATTDLLAGMPEDQVRANILSELSADLKDQADDVFDTALYWVNPSVYIGRH